jgi:hypothetical protein
LNFGAFSVEGVYELLNTGRVLLLPARGFEIERVCLLEPSFVASSGDWVRT